MTDLNTLLLTAAQRAEQQQIPYSGLLLPDEAYQLVQNAPDFVLVDVRSRAELELVGRVPLAAHVEWAFYPGMVANSEFAEQLQSTVDKDQAVVFMCRTGGRSHNAALVASKLGYSRVYNMLEGFEGDANALKQRTLINGWKHAGLPWSN